MSTTEESRLRLLLGRIDLYVSAAKGFHVLGDPPEIERALRVVLDAAREGVDILVVSQDRINGRKEGTGE